MNNSSIRQSRQGKSGLPHRIVTIGGGTGTFVVLSGLRTIPGVMATAIVSSADDGGSTGRLRDAYGILPPGDARQALVALAEPDTMLRELFTYRFRKGDVAGHNLGNLFITALADIIGSDAAAIEEASRILRITGKVLPVSERAARLKALLADGSELIGEHVIDERAHGRAHIRKLALAEPVLISRAARRAIVEADLIVLGPGDLYASTIAALLPSGVSQALSESAAKIVYVMNLFTKVGQTDRYTASKHVREIEQYAKRSINAVLMHVNVLPDEALVQYAKEGEHPVMDDLGDDRRVRRLPLASVAIVPAVPEDPVPRSLIRHDSGKIADALASLL